MGSQNTDILDQVGPLSRSGAAEVLLSINAPHCWLTKNFKSTWTALSRAFPTTAAPTPKPVLRSRYLHCVLHPK